MSAEEILALLEARIHPDPNILLDDGEYYIEEGGRRLALSHGHGLLLKHCEVTPLTPEGVAILGGYDQRSDGGWSADVDELNACCTEHPSLGCFRSRNEAIAALWEARHQAYVPAHI